MAVEREETLSTKIFMLQHECRTIVLLLSVVMNRDKGPIERSKYGRSSSSKNIQSQVYSP